MAQKFRERLLQGTGVSNKKFESDYALKLMQKMGWAQGQGLGKNKDGDVDCIQIQRRPDYQALGAQQFSLGQSWKDLWWEQSYSQSLKNLKPISSVNLQPQMESAATSEDETFSDYEKQRKPKNMKKHAQSAKILRSEEDEEEEVDNFIAIKKKIVKKQKGNQK